MTLSLQDAFAIPRAEDLSALQFVIRLDADRADDGVQRLVDDYVVTPAVATALPNLFHHLKQAAQRGEAYGHILHGGFGSGKSHLMTMLSLLLEDSPAAWQKAHPVFEALRAEHRAWVAEQKLLVVRVHMLSARRARAGLDEPLYDAVSKALVARGKRPLPVSDAAEVLAEIRAEAAAYGAAFWRRADAAKVAGSEEDLRAIEEGGPESMSELVEAWEAFRGRATSRLPWGEGLLRMAEHVRAQGFGGLVFLIDEFLLWLAEKGGEDFVTAINDMNTIVDFGGRRAIPMMVVFARQRNIRDFFPDLTSQDRIQERLDHHAKRFEVTQLQDVELRYIVRGRVLRDRRAPEAIEAAIAGLGASHHRVLDDLLGGNGAEVLHDVYPFHPALIDVLVDVSNLMQRERSALRLLYELLASSRELPLGQLLPVGRLFEHVFPPSGVEAAQKAETLQKIHAEWYQRLLPQIEAYGAERDAAGEPVSEERLTGLRQVLKTVMLGLVSPRLAGKGNERLTVERLVKLNFADASGDALRTRVNRISADLTQFHLHYAKELQLTGDGGQAVVSYALGQASLSEVLARATPKVSNQAASLKVFGKRLEAKLPKALSGLVGARDGLPFEVSWRGTRRKGRVLFGNVREQPYAAFEPAAGETFRVLIDYPWDTVGNTVGEDIKRVEDVRKKSGNLVAAAWLPSHFSAQEERVLRELAAADWVVEGGPGGELLQSYGREERTLLFEQAQTRMQALTKQIDALIDEVYNKERGEVRALLGPRDPDRNGGSLSENLEIVVRELLDRKYPQHPVFREEATRPRLGLIRDWMLDASGNSGSLHFNPETGRVLDTLGKPLEIVDVGQTRASMQEGRLMKVVLGHLADRANVAWAPIADELRREPLGLTDDVIDLLLCYACLRGYRLVNDRGDPVEPRVGVGSRNLTLQRAELLNLPQWSRARALAPVVLTGPQAELSRTLAAQDQLAKALLEGARALRAQLTALFGRLGELGQEETPRRRELKEALDRLAPLVREEADSYARLTTWLQAWPDDDSLLRATIQSLATQKSALEALDVRSRTLLQNTLGTEVGPEAEALLAELDALLTASESIRPLNARAIAHFNQEAHRLLHEALQRPPEGPKFRPPEPRRPEPPVVREEEALARVVEIRDAAALEALIAELRAAFAAEGHLRLTLARRAGSGEAP